MKQAILLDLDGTLWDSSENVMRAWNEALRNMGYAQEITQEDMQALMGLPMDEIFRALLPGISGDERRNAEDYCEIYENQYIEKHGGILYPDVKEVLQNLHKHYFLAIVSNCQKGYIEAFLKYNGYASLIDDIECFGATLKGKAENIRLVMERNQIDQALYVGDIEKDYQAAEKAGIPFILADYGFGSFSHPFSISCLKELEPMAETVFSSVSAEQMPV